MTELIEDHQATQTLWQMNEAWVAALLQKDTATLDRLMDDRCIFTDALTGLDKADFIADIEAGDLQVNTMSRDNVEIQVYDATAIMTALDTADWQYKGKHLQGYYRTLHVYAKRAQGWQIVAIQSSHIEA
ncbi:MAG TPA: nuclear transport factor 2 family protein [Blastocatellia bacterium]|nr:nuclear transport factor 2 family protein [Blastocatellia bacterium]